MNYMQGESSCDGQGGLLLSVHNQETQDAAVDLCEQSKSMQPGMSVVTVSVFL